MPIYASFIKRQDLKEVLKLNAIWKKPESRVIAAIVDTDKQTLTIMSMNLDIGVMPLYKVNNPNVPYKPDYTDLEIIDHGYTIRFGTFEAAADWALWACGLWKQP